MSYSFGNTEYGPKRFPHDILKIHFNTKISRELPSYKDALINNAKLMRDSYSEPFDVCLSGGTDSEVVVRAFKEAGISHNTFIFKLENEINVRDVNYATDLCTELGIDYKIIDFNLTHFFENDFVRVSEIAEIDRPRALPYCKILELIDGVPVFGRGEPNPIKTSNG
jgi:asparagine synthetase B (glutamine-hydrolysing)